MKRVWEDIREIDLMAYADGLLEGDAARKAAIEEYLAARPSEAERVEAMVRDNQAMRELFAGEMEEPVPRRLSRILHEPVRRRFRTPQAMVAGLALVLLAAGGGWVVGQNDDDAIAMSEDLIGGVASHHVSTTALPAVRMAASNAVNGALLSAASTDLHIEIPLPDLSAQGFSLAARKRITIAEREMIRLTYRSPDATVNLFVRLRQGGGAASDGHAATGGISVYYWSVGPLAYALTTNSTGQRAARLARMVREAIGTARMIDLPPTTAAGPMNESEAMMGDGSLEQPDRAGPIQRRFN